MNDPKTFLIELARKKMLECESKQSGLDDHALMTMPMEDLGLDSLRTLELIMDAEAEFGIEVDEDDVDHEFTLTKLLDRVSA